MYVFKIEGTRWHSGMWGPHRVRLRRSPRYRFGEIDPTLLTVTRQQMTRSVTRILVVLRASNCVKGRIRAQQETFREGFPARSVSRAVKYVGQDGTSTQAT
jgi:hypothetical protein